MQILDNTTHQHTHTTTQGHTTHHTTTQGHTTHHTTTQGHSTTTQGQHNPTTTPRKSSISSVEGGNSTLIHCCITSTLVPICPFTDSPLFYLSELKPR